MRNCFGKIPLLVIIAMMIVPFLSGTSLAVTYTLDLAVAGTGSGNIYYTSEFASGNCNSSCSLQFIEGTSVTLQADPGSNSNFAGFSGCGMVMGSCLLVMWTPASVAATFDSTWPVRSTLGTPFANLQAAYTATGTTDGQTLKTTATTFAEDLICDRNIQLTLSGGYDASFTTQSGFTTLAGSLSIIDGSIIVDNLLII